MGKYKVTEQELLEAAQRGKIAALLEPRAVKARYDKNTKQVVIELNNRCTFSFPVELGQGLQNASDKELSEIELWPTGDALHWESLDADLGVLNLLEGRLGSRKWMENLHEICGIPIGIWPDSQRAMSELGRIGGSVSSEVKAKTSRENGKKGGRPKMREKTA